MTLTEAYNQNVGTSIASPDGNPADAGQCVSWADYVLKNVYNHAYLYANAIDWWQNPGLSDTFDFISYVSGVYPKTGDFVIWGSGVGSQYGHVDVCAVDGTSSGFTGYDSNWEDIPKLSTIQHNYEYGILGYIRLKSNQGETDMVDDAGARELLTMSTLLAQDGDAPDRQPTVQEVTNLIGRTYPDAMNQIMSYQPYKNNLAKVKYYDADVNKAISTPTPPVTIPPATVVVSPTVSTGTTTVTTSPVISKATVTVADVAPEPPVNEKVSFWSKLGNWFSKLF